MEKQLNGLVKSYTISLKKKNGKEQEQFQAIISFLNANETHRFNFKELSVETLNFLKERKFKVEKRESVAFRNPKVKVNDFLKSIDYKNLKDEILLELSDRNFDSVINSIEKSFSEQLKFTKDEMQNFTTQHKDLINFKRKLFVNICKGLGISNDVTNLLNKQNVDRNEVNIAYQYLKDHSDIEPFYFLGSVLSDDQSRVYLKLIFDT